MIELRRVETESDIDTFLALRRAIDPEHQIPRAAYFQHIAEPGRVDLLAELDGKPVGCAFVEPHGDNPKGPVAMASVRVLPELRRRGVGTTLLRAVSELARADGRNSLVMVARHDDSDSLDYLGKRGFVEVLRMQQLSLDLRSAHASFEPPQGIELVPLRPELDAAIYEVTDEIDADIPSSEGVRIGTFDEWRRSELPSQTRRDCSFVARSNGEVVGYAVVRELEDAAAIHAMTGVRRGWRGRGIALALKSAQIDAAKAAGLRELRATNAVRNAPMLHVNEKLGFRRGVAWIHLRGPLLDAEP